MSRELCVAVIHGIGSQKPDFASEMIAEVRSALGALKDRVHWQSIYWAPLLQDEETKLLNRLGRGGDLDWGWLRSFVVHFLADAVAYQRVPEASKPLGVYDEIHKLIDTQLRRLRAKVAAKSSEPPLLVVAHSLGGHIMSNYIWDRQRDNEANRQGADTAFASAETLAGLVTFGCNIPLFALALRTIVPIGFPGKQLDPELAKVARWQNLYDPDDVLGYPLAPLSAAYQALVHDKAINAGGPLTSWNPASHNAYWSDNDVTSEVVDSIRQLLNA